MAKESVFERKAREAKEKAEREAQEKAKKEQEELLKQQGNQENDPPGGSIDQNAGAAANDPDTDTSEILKRKKGKNAKTDFTTIYFDPDVFKVVMSLNKEYGNRSKSDYVNKAVRKQMIADGLLKVK